MADPLGSTPSLPVFVFLKRGVRRETWRLGKFLIGVTVMNSKWTIVAVFWLVAVGQLGAAGPFDGTWTGRVMRPAPAEPQILTISLKTADNGAVTGSVAIQGGTTPTIDWGFVKGDLITFKVRMPGPNGELPFVYIGRVEGDAVAFGRRPEDLTQGRLVEFAAQRAK